MAKSRTHQLRVFQEELPQAPPARKGVPASIPPVLEAFERLTGWKLSYSVGKKPSRSSDLTWSAPVNPGVGVPPGHLSLEPVGPSVRGPRPPVSPAAVRDMVSALAGLLADLFAAQHALWRREAELATAIPVARHRAEAQHLADRLEAVLRGGAEAIGCQAAALYLLDEATTSLKLRSSWGLPQDRLALPPRPLAGALADLEAMLGHAVALEDPALRDHWNPPEAFPASVCVPLSTATAILGTVWMFAPKARAFSQSDTNIAEVVAGRLAAELEREVLLDECLMGAQLKRQLAAAERLHRNQLPAVAPLIEGWDLAGWTVQTDQLGGGFFDWFPLPGGETAVAVGEAVGDGLEAALAASGLRAAVRCHGHYQTDPDALLRQTNLTLWTGSAGDQCGSLFYGLLEPRSGRVRYASAGSVSVIRIAAGCKRPEGGRPKARQRPSETLPDDPGASHVGWESLSLPSPRVGEGAETDFRQELCVLGPGEVLLVLIDGMRAVTDSQGNSAGEAKLAEALLPRLNLPAKELAMAARGCLDKLYPCETSAGRTILLLKRTGP